MSFVYVSVCPVETKFELDSYIIKLKSRDRFYDRLIVAVTIGNE